MGIRIKLVLHGKGIIPYSYQYLLYSSILHVVRSVNSEVATKMHEQKRFKGYTFSSLFFEKGKYRSLKEGISFDGGVRWYFSSLYDEYGKLLVEGLLKRGEISIGRCRLFIQDIEVFSKPPLQNAKIFETLSPLLVQKIDDTGKRIDLYPDNEDFERFLFINIANKYQYFHNKELEYSSHFKILFNKEEYKTKRFKIKNCYYRCILGFFEIRGLPLDAMEMIYYCGLGNKNSMGFGMISIVK